MKKMVLILAVAFMLLLGCAALADDSKIEGTNWHIGEETMFFYGATGYQRPNFWQGKHFDNVTTSIKIRNYAYDEDGRLWIYGEVTSNEKIGRRCAKKRKSGISVESGDDIRYDHYRRAIRPWDYFMYFPTEVYKTK